MRKKWYLENGLHEHVWTWMQKGKSIFSDGFLAHLQWRRRKADILYSAFSQLPSIYESSTTEHLTSLLFASTASSSWVSKFTMYIGLIFVFAGILLQSNHWKEVMTRPKALQYFIGVYYNYYNNNELLKYQFKKRRIFYEMDISVCRVVLEHHYRVY